MINNVDIERWVAKDEPVFLLRIPPRARVPESVQAYLDTAEGQQARASYKCRNRTPWYTVPDVRHPAFVLTYMSGRSPALAVNRSRCTCTNALLAVDLRSGLFDDAGSFCEQRLSAAWGSPAGRLSCELEGHPLGGRDAQTRARRGPGTCLSHRTRPSTSVTVPCSRKASK